jgi:eukaryotic-like serine/threonine-protein kinase
LQIVGDNALLYSTLGMAYWQHVNIGIRPAERYLQQAEECVAKAFLLSPGSAPGHCVRGLIWVSRGNIQEATRELKSALALDPDNSEVLFWYGLLLAFAGKESTMEVARLLDIDPLTPHNQAIPALHHLFQGRFSSAIGGCREWYERDQGNPMAALVLGDVLARTGRMDEADATFGQLATGFPQTMFGQLALFLRHGLGGNKAKALEAVSPLLVDPAHLDLQHSWDIATGYALIEEQDAALEWLENAIRRGFINYPFLSRYDPLLENIRQEKRFTELMEEVRSQWERFEV